jgi:hypothetical protein
LIWEMPEGGRQATGYRGVEEAMGITATRRSAHPPQATGGVVVGYTWTYVCNE